jgi:hypothetical protein
VINHATEQKIDETDELGTTELMAPDGVRYQRTHNSMVSDWNRRRR